MPARIGARRMEAAHTRLKGGGGSSPPSPEPARLAFNLATKSQYVALLVDDL